MTPEQIIEMAKRAMSDACINSGEEPPSSEVLDSDHADPDVQWYFQRFAQLVRNEVLEECAAICDQQNPPLEHQRLLSLYSAVFRGRKT